MPVYADIERHLIDPTGVDDSEHDWHPDNAAAQKLFRCVECMRDVQEQVEHIETAKAADKRKRRAKMLATPLHSLASCLRDLLNDCLSNPDTTKKMPADAHRLIPEMLAALSQHVPVGKDRLLSQVRDKAAAHVDKTFSPRETRELIKKLELHELGLWLDVMLGILCELLKLPIYFWSCASPLPGAIRIMTCEPFLVTMRVEDGRITELLATHAVARSPKSDVSDLIMKVVNGSRFMFRPDDPQIQGFYEASITDAWARTAGSLSRFPVD